MSVGLSDDNVHRWRVDICVQAEADMGGHQERTDTST
jgi:hypothetical protein